MSTPEARLRADILQRIRADYPPSKAQVLVFGRPANASTGPGHPDLFGVALGRFFALEIKRPKEKPTPLQVQRIMDLRRAGAYAWIVRSSLDATRAVYQVKIGGPVPEQKDPIDFDEWFKSVTQSDTPPAVPQQSTPFPPEEVLSNQPEPAVDPVLKAAAEAGLDIAEPVVETPYSDMPLHNGSDSGKPDVYPDYAAQLVDAVAHQTDVLKTVGDRVTEVYEAANRVETNQRHTHRMLADLTQEMIGLRETLNKLLAEVGMDSEVAEPLPEPTPLDDVLPPEHKPKRQRRRAS